MLLFGEKIIDATAFSVNTPVRKTTREGMTRIDGLVTGEVSGHIHGIVHAYVDGSVNVNLVRGDITEGSQEALEDKSENMDPGQEKAGSNEKGDGADEKEN